MSDAVCLFGFDAADSNGPKPRRHFSRDDRPCPPLVTGTFASVGRDLGEGVIAAVALAADDAGLAGALAGERVAGSALRADGEAVTRIAGVFSFRLVVVLLQESVDRECRNKLEVLLEGGGVVNESRSDLAATLSRRLVAVAMKSPAGVAAAGAADGTAPPALRTRLLHPGGFNTGKVSKSFCARTIR